MAAFNNLTRPARSTLVAKGFRSAVTLAAALP
jgi:hypothetical protein